MSFLSRERFTRPIAALVVGVSMYASERDSHPHSAYFVLGEEIPITNGMNEYEIRLFANGRLVGPSPPTALDLEREAALAFERAYEETKLAPPTVGGVSASSLERFYWDNDPTCLARPDRYEWKRYALQAGFPDDVVNGEMEGIVGPESSNDLCAVNDVSGATCWVQQVYGGPQYLDPMTCMYAGYGKWDDDNDVIGDGIGGFDKHWRNHQ